MCTRYIFSCISVVLIICFAVNILELWLGFALCPVTLVDSTGPLCWFSAQQGRPVGIHVRFRWVGQLGCPFRASGHHNTLHCLLLARTWLILNG